MKSAAATAAGGVIVPWIVPSSVFGKNAPSNKVNIGQIGFGRIAMTHDLPETLKSDLSRVVAVSDLDSWRLNDGKKFIENWYKENRNEKSPEVSVYADYKEMLARKDIDAIIVSTPDHWHAQPAMEAALAGKDVYLQKPAALTIGEGRAMADTFHHTGRLLQIGSQQRSEDPWPQFRKAVELVRNGRIGEIKSIEIGLPGDPSGDEEKEMEFVQAFRSLIRIKNVLGSFTDFD